MSTFLHWIPMGGILEALKATTLDGFYRMAKFNPSYGIEVPDHATLDMTNDFSGCAWVYPNNRNTTQRIISKKATEVSWYMVVGIDGFLAFVHSTDGTAISVFGSTIDVPINTLSLIHFRLTGGTLYLGINGSSEQSTAKGACFVSTADIEIGKIGGTYSDDIDITQPMLFNSGSSEANFTTIYNSGKPMVYPLIPAAIKNDAVMAFELTDNDSGLIDLSGTGNNGSFVGGSFVDGESIEWDLIDPPVSANPLLLDGSNYASLLNGMNLSTNDFTISCQVNLSTINSDNVLVSQWQTSGNQRSIDLIVHPTTLQFNYSTNGTGGGGSIVVSWPWSPVINTQYSIIVERSGADLKAYIDGVAIGTTHNISTSPIHQSSSEIRIGEALYTFADALDGSFANLIITSNSGNVAELQTVKQIEDYTTSITSNLIIGIPFNNGVADPENDRSVNNYDATLVGSPTYTGVAIPWYV